MPLDTGAPSTSSMGRPPLLLEKGAAAVARPHASGRRREEQVANGVWVRRGFPGEINRLGR